MILVALEAARRTRLESTAAEKRPRHVTSPLAFVQPCVGRVLYIPHQDRYEIDVEKVERRIEVVHVQEEEGGREDVAYVVVFCEGDEGVVFVFYAGADYCEERSSEREDWC